MNNVRALFDVNGSTGRPAGATANCPSLAARLAHMDRLNIERSLVWNVEATQDHSLTCNERLLKEIAATPGASDRIVPALVLSGLIAYEKDGIERLAAQMKEANTRALRFVNVWKRLRLPQCEPVVRALLDLKPFVLVKLSEAYPRDIIYFADLFPDVPIVLTDLAWTSGLPTMDLMRRRKNILMETSLWHTWDGVRLLVNNFGAERILFGTGLLSQNGAAIAAFEAADIDDSQRDLIAHGNLDRLTGTVTKAAKERNAGSKFWRKLLNREPLGVDIVDAHGHLGGSAGYVLEHQDEKSQITEMLGVMDQLGQRTMIISGLRACLGDPIEGNREVKEFLGPHADRFGIYVAFNPRYANDLVARMDNWFQDPQYVGFKLLCSYWDVQLTDPRFEPMWEYANRHRLPVLVHTWSGGWDSPRRARDILRKYHDLSILLGHSGGTDKGRLEAEELAAEFPNVFLEWCGSFSPVRTWEETLKHVPASQVVYGTDASAHSVHWELGRLLSVNTGENAIEGILGGNMRRILGLRR